MSLELLSQNIEKEISIINEMSELFNQAEILPEADLDSRNLIKKSMDALAAQLKIINNAVPNLISNISFYKPLSQDSEKEDKQKISPGLVNISYESPSGAETRVAVRKSEELSFLDKLSIHNSAKQKIAAAVSGAKSGQGKLTASYISISNKFFRNTANQMVDRGAFKSIKTDLRRITSPFVINSYAAMMLFSTALAFVFALVIAVVLVLLKVTIFVPLLLFIGIPAGTFLVFYFYPSSKRKSLEKEINQELPFLTIYMAAIATSGIEPIKIFDILAKSKEYPVTQREIKKLANYINFYGYDPSSALKLVAKNCPSDRLAQLFDGFATTISTGGELTGFLSKHSEGLLFDYRLEREKYTHIAETFMNIYISMVIAAPMIMMMLFVLMSLTGFGSGYLSPFNIGMLTVLVIGMLNLGFLIFLNMKQPKF